MESNSLFLDYVEQTYGGRESIESCKTHNDRVSNEKKQAKQLLSLFQELDLLMKESREKIMETKRIKTELSTSDLLNSHKLESERYDLIMELNRHLNVLIKGIMSIRAHLQTPFASDFLVIEAENQK